MAFVIKKEKAYTWPITISEPSDGGGFVDQKVRVKFKMLPQARIDEVIRNEAEQDADILSDVLIGWDDGTFNDEAGNGLPFNVENKDLILSVPFIRNALIKGFFESIAGKQFKRKN
ncbi:MAG: hypothetical protein Q7U38_05745 [Methylobacter sp.]|nr:hypothetical protein [Methylobacter sp.]MDP2099837.1 hypothetical protein [Methylobacter sp.]MDP2427957.1 hypothetical protein [Methylobacter sp.]MDP3054217.1 hypothetical protein [Methylobacter sp.]MDP3361132.1 hypothetical protein [Methylobacter sp.]